MREKVRLRGNVFDHGTNAVETFRSTKQHTSHPDSVPEVREIRADYPGRFSQRASISQKISQDAVIQLGLNKVESIVISSGDEVNLFRGPGRGEYSFRACV